jgi:hypothetical protein
MARIALAYFESHRDLLGALHNLKRMRQIRARDATCPEVQILQPMTRSDHVVESNLVRASARLTLRLHALQCLGG